MNLRKYSKDKLVNITVLVFGIVTSQILLLPFSIILYVRLHVAIMPILLFGISFFMEYYHKKQFYQTLEQDLAQLEEKYLIAELIKAPSFAEGKLLKEILQEVNKSMLEHVDSYQYAQEDYKEYIELWIHEVKMPIATSKMIIENNTTSVTRSINEELDKIENYIEQALFYARSNTVEKDYYVKKTNLKEIVNQSILKNKGSLIQNNVNLNIYDLDKEVYTDPKWCVFMLNQILQNAIKYSKIKDRKIEICAIEKKEQIILKIQDNGIGIRKGEITRVFEKGFTGENGRKNRQKSTGIGLYLCKKLANKLGIGLELNSEKEIGTEVKMVFPKNSFMEVTS